MKKDERLERSKNKLSELGADWVVSDKGKHAQLILNKWGHGELLIEYLADIMKSNRVRRNFLDEYNDVAHDSDDLYLGFTTSRKARLEIGKLIVYKLNKGGEV